MNVSRCDVSWYPNLSLEISLQEIKAPHTLNRGIQLSFLTCVLFSNYVIMKVKDDESVRLYRPGLDLY